MLKNIFSKKVILLTVVIAFCYILLVSYLMNFSLIKNTVFEENNLSFKLKILFYTAEGIFTSMNAIGIAMLVITAILSGLNIALILQRISLLRKLNRFNFAISGGSFLGIVSSGCASCGLPVVSLIGLSGSIVFLPFKGGELPYISISLLLLSLYFLVKNNKSVKECEVK